MQPGSRCCLGQPIHPRIGSGWWRRVSMGSSRTIRPRCSNSWDGRRDSVMMRAWIVAALAVAAAYGQAQVAAISHRGEHLKHPENTITAYRAAYEADADYIETDVRTTSDGKLVIMHDT